MESTDILINSLLSLFVGIAAAIIRLYFELDTNIVIIITFLVISLFWIGSSIKETKQRLIDNSEKIKGIRNDIKYIEKDLNINKRLSKLEVWKEEMIKKKKGQIDVVDLIKIGAVIIIGYLLLKALGVSF